MSRRTRLDRAGDGHWVGTFSAMASPCEVLMDVEDRQEAHRLLAIAADEAWRVEDKFSRYLPGNVVDAINRSDGAPVAVDEETARLLDFAARLHALSEGRFDITSGVLRRVWSFDGRRPPPSTEEIAAVLPLVGWRRAEWDGERLRLEPGMQIDFGGIGKEYAVDRAAGLVAAASSASCMVNFGGDLAMTRPRTDGEAWRIGIEESSRSVRVAPRRAALGCAGHQRDHQALRARRRRPLRAHPRSRVGMAGGGMSALGDGRCRVLRRGGNARDAGHAAGSRSRGFPRPAGSALLGHALNHGASGAKCWRTLAVI